MSSRSQRPGFTLVELLLGIGIMGVLTSLVLVAINPSKQLEDAENAKRLTYSREQEKALIQYLISEWEEPADIAPGEYNAVPICRPGVTHPSCVNLDLIVPVFLAAIPVDRAATGAIVTGYRTYTENSRWHVCNDFLPPKYPQRCSLEPPVSGGSSQAAASSAVSSAILAGDPSSYCDISFPERVHYVAVHPSGTTAYVTSLTKFFVLDVASHSITDTLDIGTNAYSIVLSPDGTRAYTANYSTSNVSVINTVSKSVIATIAVGTNPSRPALSPDGTRLYVPNFGSNSVSVINTASNTVVATVAMSGDPRAAAVSADGSKVFVARFGGNSVGVIDTATNTVVTSIPVGTQPECVILSPDGTRLIVTTASSWDTTKIINTATNAVVASIAAGATNNAAFSPDGSKAYITNPSGTVVVINMATSAILSTLATGANSHYVSLLPDGTKAYVSNGGADTLSVINAVSDAVTTNFTMAQDPVNIAVNPSGTEIYVPQDINRTVRIIGTAIPTPPSMVSPCLASPV